MSQEAMVAGLLLTGGASRRLGTDKADFDPGDGFGSLAQRAVAGMTKAGLFPLFELGPGRTGLPCVLDDPPLSGPLVAVAAGGRALVEADHHGPAIALAVDMPGVTSELLRFLAFHPGVGSVVPVVGGHPQVLCARWSAAALSRASVLAAGGERAVRALLDDDVTLVDEAAWQTVATMASFHDIDSPADADWWLEHRRRAERRE